jgi:NAD(P)-dependent dehydrogenase (short-subunit alcohol dehydrogenase family)
MLQGKTAIVYGAGPVGAAVARAFARQGATVHLASRSEKRLTKVRAAIEDGRVHTAIVDATDSAAAAAHAAAVVEAAGGIDIAFNAVANDDVQGTPLVNMALADVVTPVVKAVTAQLVISTAVARHMLAQQRGVILAMAGGREAIPNLGGSHVAWAALAGMCRQLASELGPSGIRVAWLLSPGSPDSGGADPEAGNTLLNHRPSYDEVGAVAAFLASDDARSMTATEVNLTGGAVID